MFFTVIQPPRFDDREAAERVATPGVSVGLVWTTFGGEVQFVEATSMVGTGELHLTGQLGDVIKESAQIAVTWVIYYSELYCKLFSSQLIMNWQVLLLPHGVCSCIVLIKY